MVHGATVAQQVAGTGSHAGLLEHRLSARVKGGNLGDSTPQLHWEVVVVWGLLEAFKPAVDESHTLGLNGGRGKAQRSGRKGCGVRRAKRATQPSSI